MIARTDSGRGRSAHQALDALWQGLMKLGGGWVIDLDIEDFFGSVDWGHLRSFLDRRVRDGVIRRAIGKWLNAGVMEAGKLSHPQRGTPQGGVVSLGHALAAVQALHGVGGDARVELTPQPFEDQRRGRSRRRWRRAHRVHRRSVLRAP